MLRKLRVRMVTAALLAALLTNPRLKQLVRLEDILDERCGRYPLVQAIKDIAGRLVPIVDCLPNSINNDGSPCLGQSVCSVRRRHLTPLAAIRGGVDDSSPNDFRPGGARLSIAGLTGRHERSLQTPGARVFTGLAKHLLRVGRLSDPIVSLTRRAFR